MAFLVGLYNANADSNEIRSKGLLQVCTVITNFYLHSVHFRNAYIIQCPLFLETAGHTDKNADDRDTCFPLLAGVVQ